MRRHLELSIPDEACKRWLGLHIQYYWETLISGLQTSNSANQKLLNAITLLKTKQPPTNIAVDTKAGKRRLKAVKALRHRLYVNNHDLLIYLQNNGAPCLVIPKACKHKVLKAFHSGGLVGNHLGRSAMMTSMSRYVWWPTMLSDIISYVQFCELCGVNKHSTINQRQNRQQVGYPFNIGLKLSIDCWTSSACWIG